MFFAGCVFFLTAILFNQYGLLHPETGTYIPFHLSGKPLPEIIFNSNILEHAPSTQARELSYIVDHFDVLMLAKSVQYGFPLFIPASNFIFTTIFGVILFGFFTKAFQLGRLESALLVLAFWATPHAYIMLIYRSAKPGAGFFCVLLLMLVYLAIKKLREQDLQELRAGGEKAGETGPGWRRNALLFACGVVLSMFDLQGLYLLAVTTIAVGIISFCMRSRRMTGILWPLVSAIIVHLFYFFIALPFLAAHFGNCTVIYSYNKLDLFMILTGGIKAGMESLGMFVNLMLFSFGNLPAFPFALLILGVFVFLIQHDEKQTRYCKDPRPRGGLLPVFIFAFFAIWAMFFGMYMKLAAISWPDFQRWFYGVPTVMCIFFLSGMLAGLVRAPAAKTAVRVALFLILLFNIAALPGHLSQFRSGYFSNAAMASPYMRDALLNVYNQNYKPNPILYSSIYIYTGPDRAGNVFVQNGVLTNKVTIYDSLRKYALEHSWATQPLHVNMHPAP